MKSAASVMAIGALVLGSISTIAPVPAWSQSTDFSRPTPITTVPLIGEHDGSKNTANYYSFTAGPGSILVTFDGQASKYSTSAQVKLYDTSRNSLGEVALVALTSPSSATKRITLSKRQRVVLETVFHEDTTMGVMKYSVNLSGPVELEREDPSASTMPRTAPQRTTGSTGTSRSGKIQIHMMDGSVKEFDMSSVRRIVVE